MKYAVFIPIATIKKFNPIRKETLVKLALITFALSALTSCKKEDYTADILEKGTWHITVYTDHETDETAHFAGYSFSFDHDGTVTASKSGSVVTGTWTAASSSHEDKLILDFGTTAVFEDLTDDWHITRKTSKEIRLQDTSGGNGDTDLLTFERL